MSNIEGKVVVITGASSGLGEATARHLASKGASVFLGARRMDRLQTVVAYIQRAGSQAAAMQVDVTRRAEVDAFVQAATEKFGRMDVLVNNAGLMAAITEDVDGADPGYHKAASSRREHRCCVRGADGGRAAPNRRSPGTSEGARRSLSRAPGCARRKVNHGH